MSVQALDRTFDLLELLARFPEGLGLGDISEKIGLHKSTVHRLLSSLKSRGYIEQAEDSGSYRIGVAFIALAAPYLNQLDLKTEAEPEMRRLSDKLGITVYMAALRDGEVVYLDKVERYDGFRRFDIIGRHVPVHCTSLGKSLLMDFSPGQIRDILEKHPPVKKTSKTIINTEAIIADIETCRNRGWSSDIEEHEEGVNCVGAPIRDYRGRIVAAISAVWRVNRSGEEMEEAGGRVAETAAVISERLGFKP